MENDSRRTEEIFYGNNGSKGTNYSKNDNTFKWQKWPFGKSYIKTKQTQCMSNQLINLFKELAQRNACLDAGGSQRYRQRIAFI